MLTHELNYISIFDNILTVPKFNNNNIIRFVGLEISVVGKQAFHPEFLVSYL
jgi:hypothetical protein